MTTSPPKILIVDDEPLNIEVLSEMLSGLGEVIFATNGPTALDICAQIHPDIVLLDIMMPGMSGYDVCRTLKASEATADIPVIFVTALAEQNDEAFGIELGAIDYITKPIVAPIVMARVRNQLELKRYRSYLEQIAFIDGLTGIPNRRRFDQFMDAEWKRAQRNGSPIALLFMDIDFFKRYNDSLGHQAGDRCLIEVAQILSNAVRRPADMIARYGGEEFVCVLPETDLDGARAFAETLIHTIRGKCLPHPESDVAECVTLSIGVASMIADNDSTLAEMIAKADTNLYAAKRGGRNRAESG